MTKANVAVIGAGYWGKNLIRNFHRLGALSLICDENIKTLEGFRQEYPDTRTFHSPDKVFLDEAVEAVAIATPAETHYALAKEALLRGKDVFVEKPLSLSVKEGTELCRIANENNRVLMIFDDLVNRYGY